MKMKITKYIFLFVLPVMFALNAVGQNTKKEEIRAQKAAYLTANMNISESQAKAFWPVYNAFEEEMIKLRKEKRSLYKGSKKAMDFTELSDKELNDFFIQRFDFEEKELKIKREYHEKFLKVLSIQQVAALYQAEIDFRRKVIQKVHNKN
jgi:ribosome-binding ATPase YchF (GTP1/OBG family)